MSSGIVSVNGKACLHIPSSETGMTKRSNFIFKFNEAIEIPGKYQTMQHPCVRFVTVSQVKFQNEYQCRQNVDLQLSSETFEAVLAEVSLQKMLSQQIGIVDLEGVPTGKPRDQMFISFCNRVIQ